MSAVNFTGLIHPALAIVVIFPLLGIVIHYAWQTRQRRLQVQMKDSGKSKIPPSVGTEHLKIGRWLSNGVVLLALIGLAHPIFFKMAKNEVWAKEGLRPWFVVLIFLATIASLVILNRARTKLWRGIFASLTGMGLVLLGSQPEVFRRGEIFDFTNGQWFTSEWYVSHYYYGVAAAFLMIFSLATFPDIYQDRTNRWRTVHIILNCLATLLFIGQGITGSRDLLDIPPGFY